MAESKQETMYQLVIDCEQASGEIKRLFLDTCFEKNATASAQIAQQPVQSGRVISDHMYSMPDEFTIRGTFSLYGNLQYDFDDFEGVGNSTDRLTNIENVFEYIKDNGLLCTLVTLDTSKQDGSVRFKQRDNMALKNITWTEKLASVDYTLSFVEIMTVDMQNPPVALTNYPETIMPSARSLGQIMVEDAGDDLIKMVLEALYNAKYISKTDLEYMWAVNEHGVGFGNGEVNRWMINLLVSTAISVGVLAGAFVVGEALIAGTLVALGATSAIVPVGTIVAAAVAATIAIGACIWYLFNKAQEEQKLKMAFHLVTGIENHITENANGEKVLDIQGAITDGNCKLNNTELVKLQKLLVDVKNAVIGYSSGVEIYQVSSGIDDNSSRTVCIKINDWPYYIDFIKDEINTTYGWNFNVTTLNSSGDQVSVDGSNGMKFTNKVVSDLSNCNLNENCFFCDKTYQKFVYIFNPNLNPTINRSQEDFDSVKTKLCGYQIVVSDGDLKEKIDKINDVIMDTIKSRGYL